jgi:hypothetical protein
MARKSAVAASEEQKAGSRRLAASRDRGEAGLDPSCPCSTGRHFSAQLMPMCGSTSWLIGAARQTKFKSCHECNALNPTTAVSCHSCGASFSANFVLTLDEALRTGAIIRGMDLDEEEVRVGEQIAAPTRERILRSGDDQLVRILRILPEESFARLNDQP